MSLPSSALEKKYIKKYKKLKIKKCLLAKKKNVIEQD